MRRLVPLALVFLAVGLSTAMASPFLALFLTEAVHADGVRTGVFLAAGPVSTVLVATLVGRLSDRLATRRWLLVAAALAGCAGTAVPIAVRNYRLLLLSGITLTAAAGALMPQLFAYARESLGDAGRVALAMSSLRSLFSLAWVAGPPLAAVLLHLGGFGLVYGGSSAMYAVAAVVVMVALREPRPSAPPAPGASRAPDRDDDARPVSASGTAPAVRRDDAPRLLLWSTVAAFVLTRCAGTLSVQALPLFTTRVLHAPVPDAGLLLGLCAALEIPAMIGFGLLSTRIPVRRLLVAGGLCGAAYLAIVSVATSTWELAVGQVLNAASIAALTGLGISYVQDMLPRQLGRAATIYTNTFATGAMIAGPVLGLAQQLGYRMPFAVGAGLDAVAVLLLAATRLVHVRRSSAPSGDVVHREVTDSEREVADQYHSGDLPAAGAAHGR